VRSPSSPFVETTVNPIFLPTVPDRNPRTECGCQPLAFCRSMDVTPPGRFSRSRILAALLPSRAPLPFYALLGAFLAGVAFFPDLASKGATWRARLSTLAFFVGFATVFSAGWAVSVCSVVDVMISPFWAVITASRHRSLRCSGNASKFWRKCLWR